MKRGRIGFTPANMDGRPSVTGVRPGLPAEKAGLKGGELLLKIDGHATQGLGNGALDFLAAGKVDKPLVITVQPREGGGPRDVTIERASMDYDPSRPGTAKTPVASGGTAATTTPPRGQAAPAR
jgi:C-terminal processing protease CtpA/Prc